MPIKLIIFDLDGTLVDSSVDITNALNYAIEPYGLKLLTREDTIGLVGEGITRLIEKMLLFAGKDSNKQVSTDLQADITKRFLEYYTAHLLDYTKEYPGARETLKQLGSYKKAVISNKREVLSRKTISGLGLSQFFDTVIGSDTTPEKKPSPIPVLKALSEFNIRPEEAIIVGDSNLDIDAGKAAGITTVAVSYGYRPREVIAHADYIIDRLTELIPLLDKINKGT